MTPAENLNQMMAFLPIMVIVVPIILVVIMLIGNVQERMSKPKTSILDSMFKDSTHDPDICKCDDCTDELKSRKSNQKTNDHHDRLKGKTHD